MRGQFADSETIVVKSVQSIAVRIPLRRPVRFSTRRLDAREFVLVQIEDRSGAIGTGVSYVGEGAAPVAKTYVDNLLSPFLLTGAPISPAKTWQNLYQQTLLVGRRGIGLRCLSAVDLALWDILARHQGQPLCQILGSTLRAVPAYASGGYYRSGDPVKEIERELAKYVGMGFRDFKIKVGGAEIQVDLQRVRAARQIIGSEARLALDANNAWADPIEARNFIDQVQQYEPWWIEEPLSPDDIEGHAILTAESSIPIATGEIHNTRWEFAELLRRHACDILQPDVGVVGGITEWLRVVEMADSDGVPIAPHWNANLHVQLAAASKSCLGVEYFALDEEIFNFEALVQEPLKVSDGQLTVPDAPGLGFVLSQDALDRWSI